MRLQQNRDHSDFSRANILIEAKMKQEDAEVWYRVMFT